MEASLSRCADDMTIDLLAREIHWKQATRNAVERARASASASSYYLFVLQGKHDAFMYYVTLTSQEMAFDVLTTNHLQSTLPIYIHSWPSPRVLYRTNVIVALKPKHQNKKKCFWKRECRQILPESHADKALMNFQKLEKISRRRWNWC